MKKDKKYEVALEATEDGLRDWVSALKSAFELSKNSADIKALAYLEGSIEDVYDRATEEVQEEREELRKLSEEVRELDSKIDRLKYGG